MSLPFNWGFTRAFLKNAIQVRFSGNPRVDPLILSYFVTFRCNLQCRYCDYIDGNLSSRYPDANTEDAKEILRICREGVPSVAFTGGEPLVRRDIVELVHYARRSGYRPISLFTNSLLLPEKEEVLDSVDYLQISLDSLDEKVQDDLCQKSGIGSRVKANVERYARLQKEKHFRLNINSVISPRNLDDVVDLLEFALENRVRFTFSPQLDDIGQPSSDILLPEYFDRYRRVVDTILKYKKKGNVVMDVVPFISHLRSLQPSACHPNLTPRVYPDGTLQYPCPALRVQQLDVLKAGSWQRLMSSADGFVTPCPRPCFLPCYLETSLLIRHPLTVFQELRPLSVFESK